MKLTHTFLFILLCSFTSSSQLEKDYFFDDLPINDSTSLVLIINEPQTQFARELNNRIYSDTNFIKQLKENWYTEREQGNGHTGHRCGYDLYFYKTSPSQGLIPLNHLNSNCGLTKVGCSNLKILSESGKQLQADTIRRLRMSAFRDKLFTEDLIQVNYLDLSEWGYCRTKKYPKMYYEGVFKTKIQLDTNYSMQENGEIFIQTYTDDMVGINWNIEDYRISKEDKTKLENFKRIKRTCEVEISVFLKKSKFHFFETHTIDTVKFEIPRGKNLIMIYD